MRKIDKSLVCASNVRSDKHIHLVEHYIRIVNVISGLSGNDMS